MFKNFEFLKLCKKLNAIIMISSSVFVFMIFLGSVRMVGAEDCSGEISIEKEFIVELETACVLASDGERRAAIDNDWPRKFRELLDEAQESCEQGCRAVPTEIIVSDEGCDDFFDTRNKKLHYSIEAEFVYQKSTTPTPSPTPTPTPSPEPSPPKTIVTLLSFDAQAIDGNTIVLKWETATEIDTVGFYLWRSVGESKTYTKISDFLIPSQGGGTWGAEYAYKDSDVVLGQTYHYQLEDVEFDGDSALHGPVSETVEEE